MQKVWLNNILDSGGTKCSAAVCQCVWGGRCYIGKNGKGCTVGMKLQKHCCCAKNEWDICSVIVLSIYLWSHCQKQMTVCECVTADLESKAQQL